ncbi:MAG TPA: hypothetical protein VFG54_11510 [Prolixibacteraceae bacterium]|nr:hypothetical protein [Prolixibacteraceae bacterium]
MKTLFRLFTADNIYMKAIIVIVIALTMAGCEKDEEKYELVKIDPSLKPFLFDKGSYWIYTMYPIKADTIVIQKDSLSAPKDSIIFVNDSINVLRDSVSVESIAKDTIYPTGMPRYYEIYDIKYFSSLNDSIYNEQLIGYVITKGQVNGGFVLLSSKKKADKSLNAEIVNVSDEMTLNKVTYNQVVKMKVSKDKYIKDSYYLYYVDKIGVVRKEKLGMNAAGKEDSVVERWDLKKSSIQLLKVE